MAQAASAMSNRMLGSGSGATPISAGETPIATVPTTAARSSPASRVALLFTSNQMSPRFNSSAAGEVSGKVEKVAMARDRSASAVVKICATTGGAKGLAAGLSSKGSRSKGSMPERSVMPKVQRV